MYLLDTNVISELRKTGQGKADTNVIAWLSGVDAEQLFISVITLMELELGIARMLRRDARQGQQLRLWMDQRVLPEFADRTLSVDAAIARRCAHLHVPDPKPERDAWIASTALVHDMTVVTRNVADFSGLHVPMLNPWNKH